MSTRGRTDTIGVNGRKKIAAIGFPLRGKDEVKGDTYQR